MIRCEIERVGTNQRVLLLVKAKSRDNFHNKENEFVSFIQIT